MKANGAPEKIYISNYSSGLTYNWHPERLAIKDIEYIRTDAFIEKACDAYCKVCDTKECGGTGECLWVEKFRKRLIK